MYKRRRITNDRIVVLVVYSFCKLRTFGKKNMSFLLPIILISLLLLLIFVKYVAPILQRHRQLLKDYRNISFLPLSSIPFVGNLHQFDKRSAVFFQLLCRLTKQCQDQNQGLFCLWFGISPRLFLCSGQGLEVYLPIYFDLKIPFFFVFLRHLSLILDNLLNHLIMFFLSLGLVLVSSLGNRIFIKKKSKSNYSPIVITKNGVVAVV